MAWLKKLTVYFILAIGLGVASSPIYAQSHVCFQNFKDSCASEHRFACDAGTKLGEFSSRYDFYKQLRLNAAQLANLESQHRSLQDSYSRSVYEFERCERTPTLRCDQPNEQVSNDGFNCECAQQFRRDSRGQCLPVENCQPIVNLRPLEEIRRREDGRFVAGNGACFVQAVCASGTLITVTSNVLSCEIGAEICNDDYRPVCAHRRTECSFGTCYDMARSFQNACWARHEKHYMILDGECPTTNYCADELVRDDELNICVVPTAKVMPPLKPTPPIKPTTPPEPVKPPELVKPPEPVEEKIKPKTTECKPLFVYDQAQRTCVPDKDEILRQVCQAKRLVWKNGRCR